MSEAALNEKNKQADVIENGTVLLDFWAPWCGPCSMLAPILEEVKTECPQVPIVKVNVDEEPELASKFQVMSIPTLVFIENGEKKAVTVGVKPKEEILKMISQS